MKIKSLILSLAAFVSALTFVSCSKEDPKKDTLTVEPSSAISFKAASNMDVRLKVTTSAKEWSFTAPEWVSTKKEAKSLIVNVKENTSKDANIGRIIISAGNAEPVKISVLQEGNEGTNPNPGDGVSVKLNDKGGSMNIFAVKGKNTVASFTAVIAEAAAKDVEVELFVDSEYLSEYNYLNQQAAVVFPADKIGLPANTKITIPAGKTESAPVEVSFDAASLDFGTQYLIPLYIKPVKYASVKQDARLNYLLMKKADRAIKNVLYFEVNDVNPLNALEYVLTDGTPFFDAVILFAANINYNQKEDLVYLHNNPNVQALLDETDVYLQPLRKAGIKVYLGLLGNHTPAGLAALSDWGCHEWAQEVADACKKYKLDGVNLDDEYSSAPLYNNKWFTGTTSSASAARLMYELKMAMKEKCSWPTEVSHFDWGAISSVPSVEVDGVVHRPVEFVDFHVANYGSASSPYGGMTLAQCSGASIELNRGYLPGGNWAENLRNGGYGWCMWFAFDPSGTGSVYSNYSRAFPLFRQAAQAFYGQDVKVPTGVYNKLGEGKYDPKRYSR